MRKDRRNGKLEFRKNTAERTELHCIYLSLLLIVTISLLIFSNPETLVITENTCLQYIWSIVMFIQRHKIQ